MQVKACVAAVKAVRAAAGVRDSRAVRAMLRAVDRVMLRAVDRVMLRAVGRVTLRAVGRVTLRAVDRVTRRAVRGMVRGHRVEAVPGTGRRVGRASCGLL